MKKLLFICLAMFWGMMAKTQTASIDYSLDETVGSGNLPKNLNIISKDKIGPEDSWGIEF